ncbi:hypothetical protein [Vibrio lentus]|uniref:YbbD head domain-containing protein n=1 Tax=Vibrio lentus TaxID=136468 RepID=A0A2N7IAY7_9VIBR|nr:hypothetical protein [Vibrio lentus]PML53537.1 hypothetical protein BCT74_09245 [Vibrio lentus]PMM39698.1 hypothetical protein BCT58_22255 [Vibrio lentus]
MKVISLLSALVLLAGCSDAVTNQYATYAEAQQDSLFERGWLPDILPESTIDIEVVNNLDNNTSHGGFLIEESGLQVFLQQVKPTDSDNQYRFVEGDHVWTFTVNTDGLVTYRLDSF